MTTGDSAAAQAPEPGASESVAASRLTGIALGLAASAWLLLLLGLALAWDPLDRRLGIRDRRRAGRRATLPAPGPASNGAYGIRPADSAPEPTSFAA